MKKKAPKEKIDGLAIELRRIGVKLENNDDKISLVAEMVGHLSGEMKTVTESVGHLSKNMEIIKEDIEFIKSGFKKKVDIDEFSALERRVSILERHR